MGDYNSDGSVTSSYLAGRKTYGQGNALTSEQVAQILYQVGFRGDDLVYFTGIAMRETGNQPGTHGTNSDPSRLTGDLGLFGMNYINDTPGAKAAVGYSSRADWFNPVVNAKLAYYVSKGGRDKSAWRGSAGGYSNNGDPYYGVNMTAARKAVDNATAQGLLGKDWTSGGSSASSSGGQGVSNTSSGTSSSGPFTLPSDAQLFQTDMGIFAVFDVGGTKISYGVNWWDGSVTIEPSKLQNISSAQFNAMGAVNGGNAEELRNLGFGSFSEFFNSILGQVMGYNNPAKNDPEVLRVIAEFAGRPDMTAAELQAKLQATQWYQTHTTSQLEWNGLPDAEKQKRRGETASQMAQVWFQFGGVSIDQSDPRIGNYLEDVASGKMGIGAFTQLVKTQAAGDAESPWSRQMRDEEKARLQNGVDIENTTQRVSDLARRWGVQWNPQTAADWGAKIVSNQASEADVLNELKTQAKILYPWLSGETETMTAARPWLDTYSRVMEKDGDIFNPKVQSALTKGAAPWEFEQELKRTSEWLGTKNAQDSIYSTVGNLGRLMGFA